MSTVCSFCGHSWTSESIREPLLREVERLITEHDVTCFYVGNNGGFDMMATGVLRTLQQRYLHIQFCRVLAYMPGGKEKFSSSAQIETVYPEGLESVPRRYAIVHRNRWMVQQSDYLIAYVLHDSGGAAQTLRYAKGRGSVKIINLADAATEKGNL